MTLFISGRKVKPDGGPTNPGMWNTGSPHPMQQQQQPPPQSGPSIIDFNLNTPSPISGVQGEHSNQLQVPDLPSAYPGGDPNSHPRMMQPGAIMHQHPGMQPGQVVVMQSNPMQGQMMPPGMMQRHMQPGPNQVNQGMVHGFNTMMHGNVAMVHPGNMMPMHGGNIPQHDNVSTMLLQRMYHVLYPKVLIVLIVSEPANTTSPALPGPTPATPATPVPATRPRGRPSWTPTKQTPSYLDWTAGVLEYW